jgi:hypothetical protein
MFVPSEKRWHYVIVPNVTFPNVIIPKLVQIPNINRYPTIPPLYMPEASLACQGPPNGKGAELGEGERD